MMCGIDERKFKNASEVTQLRSFHQIANVTEKKLVPYNCDTIFIIKKYWPNLVLIMFCWVSNFLSNQFIEVINRSFESDSDAIVCAVNSCWARNHLQFGMLNKCNVIQKIIMNHNLRSVGRHLCYPSSCFLLFLDHTLNAQSLKSGNNQQYLQYNFSCSKMFKSNQCINNIAERIAVCSNHCLGLGAYQFCCLLFLS